VKTISWSSCLLNHPSSMRAMYRSSFEWLYPMSTLCQIYGSEFHSFHRYKLCRGTCLRLGGILLTIPKARSSPVVALVSPNHEQAFRGKILNVETINYNVHKEYASHLSAFGWIYTHFHLLKMSILAYVDMVTCILYLLITNRSVYTHNSNSESLSVFTHSMILIWVLRSWHQETAEHTPLVYCACMVFRPYQSGQDIHTVIQIYILSMPSKSHVLTTLT